MSDRLTILPNTKRIGIAADHGGYELKEYLAVKLREAGHEVIDFGDVRPKEEDDYPDYIVPLALAVASRVVARGVAICGSGVPFHADAATHDELARKVNEKICAGYELLGPPFLSKKMIYQPMTKPIQPISPPPTP
jgi:hypothetical protein